MNIITPEQALTKPIISHFLSQQFIEFDSVRVVNAILPTSIKTVIQRLRDNDWRTLVTQTTNISNQAFRHIEISVDCAMADGIVGPEGLDVGQFIMDGRNNTFFLSDKGNIQVIHQVNITIVNRRVLSVKAF